MLLSVPYVSIAIRRDRIDTGGYDAPTRDALLAWRRIQRTRWLKKGEPMPEWVFPSLTGTPRGRAQRAACPQARAGEGGPASYPHPRPPAYVRDAPASGRGADHLRECPTRASRRSITLRVYAHYLPSGSHREADRLDLPHRSATPAQPEAVSADLANELSGCKERSDPDFHQLEPDGELATPTPGAPTSRIVKRGRSLRITST